MESMACAMKLSYSAPLTTHTLVDRKGDGCSSPASGISLHTIPCGIAGSSTSQLHLPRQSSPRWSSFRAQAVDERSVAGSAVTEGAEKSEAGACPGCGQAERVGGCNGEGRIQGGIGAVPGFKWWPIKAFRPCPAFIESGGRYRRIGQSLDEVAFGRKGAEDDKDISDRLKGQR